jgi:putative MATE family efflux protein
MSESAKKPRDRRDLVSGSLPRNITRLALPIAAGIILYSLYSMVDVFWLGRLGEGEETARAIAAPGVSWPFVWLVLSFAMGFSVAGTAIVAQFTGAGRHDEADASAAQMFTVLLGIVAAFGLPMFLFAAQFLTLFRVPQDALPTAVGYVRILIIGLPALVIGIGFGAVMRALGDSLTPVLIQVAGNAVNMVLDPVFIFGLGPLPMMGASGAATATVISQAFSACVCVYLLHRGRGGLHIRPGNLKPDWPLLRRMVSVGLPTAVGNSSNALGYAVFQVVVNTLGTVVISAMTVGFRAVHFVLSPGEGIQMAVAPVVGQALGANRPDLAERAVTGSSKVMALILLPPTVFLTWQRHRIAAFLVDDPAVAAETARLLLLFPISLYFFYVTLVLMAAFFGSGHTKPAMALHMFRLWGLRLPAAIILAKVLGYGSWGVYGAMVFGNVISAALSIWLYRRGAWKHAVVPTAVEP